MLPAVTLLRRVTELLHAKLKLTIDFFRAAFTMRARKADAAASVSDDENGKERSPTGQQLPAGYLIFLLAALLLLFGVNAVSTTDDLHALRLVRNGSLHGRELRRGTNIVYVKVMKTGSTTMSGALRRVCVHHGLSGCRNASWIEHEPGLWAKHGPFDATMHEVVARRFSRDYDSRDRPQPPDLAVLGRLTRPIFLMTMVRGPASRCLSQHYYFNSTPITDATRLKALGKCNEFMTRYLWPSGAGSSLRPDAAANVLQAYDLVGVAERLDETLVLIAASLGVPLAHVLVAAAKNSSQATRDPETGRLAPHHPPLHLEAPAVRAYAGGPIFAARNAQDVALWRGANARIEALFEGSAALRGALGTLRGLQARARARCAPEFTADGVPAHRMRCLFNDQACNYECLDRVFQADEAPVPTLGSEV